MIKKRNFKNIKIASRTLKFDFDLAKEIISLNKNTFISLGMWKKNDFPFKKNKNIKYLWCLSKYPTEPEDLIGLPKKFSEKDFYGYSDHSIGIETCILAASRGADIIEKHFTLDKGLEGPDHKASISPDELKELIILLHNVKKALGSSKKMITKSEKKNVNLVRKKIYSSRLIRKGERFSTKNLKTLRAPRGISAAEWYKYIGKKSDRYYLENQEIKKLTN